jgi:plasmid replication initiation protein
MKSEDEDFKPHKLRIIDFSNMVGVKAENQYKELRSITKRLMQRAMEIYEPEKKEHIQVSWLSSARYQHTKGCVILKFDPELKPYLLQLKSHFTRIKISDVLELKSIYSIRIFELLLQYVHIGKRRVSIDDLKLYCGVEQKEYGFYADFKRFAIERAKREVNSKTGYEINYTEIKKSRKVIALEWTIKKRTHFEKLQEDKAQIIQKEIRSSNAITEEIIEYGFSRVTAKKFLQKYSEDVIKNALKAVNLQIERNNVKNPKAMLRVAMQEGWKPDVYMAKNSQRS